MHFDNFSFLSFNNATLPYTLYNVNVPFNLISYLKLIVVVLVKFIKVIIGTLAPDEKKENISNLVILQCCYKKNIAVST